MKPTLLTLSLTLFVPICLPSLSAQGSHTVILAARRAGDVEFIDSQTLQTLGFLHFSLPDPTVGLNGMSVSADGTTLYVDGPTPSNPLSCCALYAVDLATFQSTLAASIPGTPRAMRSSIPTEWYILRSFFMAILSRH